MPPNNPLGYASPAEERARRLAALGSLLGQQQAGGVPAPEAAPAPQPAGGGPQEFGTPQPVQPIGGEPAPPSVDGQAPEGEAGLPEEQLPQDGNPPKLDFTDIIRDFIQFVRDNRGNQKAIRDARNQMQGAIRDRVQDFRDQMRAFAQGRQSRLKDRLQGTTQQLAQRGSNSQSVSQSQNISTGQAIEGSGVTRISGNDGALGPNTSRRKKLSGIQSHLDTLGKLQNLGG